MFTHSPRTASCITISETELLEIKRSDFQWMVKQYDRVRDVLSRFYKARVLDTILIKSEIFCLLAPEVRQQLIDRLIPEEFKNGDTIIEEGTSGDCLYIIREGSVEVTAKKQGKQVHLANLRSGDFFGEVALLKLTKRTATVRAKENCDILRLDPESFYWITKQYPQIEKTLKTLAQKRTEQTLRAVA
jgi:CRP-like cAMP-binding protein